MENLSGSLSISFTSPMPSQRELLSIDPSTSSQTGWHHESGVETSSPSSTVVQDARLIQTALQTTCLRSSPTSFPLSKRTANPKKIDIQPSNHLNDIQFQLSQCSKLPYIPAVAITLPTNFAIDNLDSDRDQRPNAQLYTTKLRR